MVIADTDMIKADTVISESVEVSANRYVDPSLPVTDSYLIAQGYIRTVTPICDKPQVSGFMIIKLSIVKSDQLNFNDKKRNRKSCEDD